MRNTSFAIGMVVVGLCAGCSSQQIYATGQNMQRQQCFNMPDQGDRERCLNNASTSYDDYKRETSQVNK